jgi:hypothetical protein
MATRRLHVDAGTFVPGCDVTVRGDGPRPLATLEANHLGGLEAQVDDHGVAGPLLRLEGEGVAGTKRFFCPASRVPTGGPAFEAAMAFEQRMAQADKRAQATVERVLQAQGVTALRELSDRRWRLTVYALAALAVVEAATLGIVVL